MNVPTPSLHPSQTKQQRWLHTGVCVSASVQIKPSSTPPSASVAFQHDGKNATARRFESRRQDDRTTKEREEMLGGKKKWRAMVSVCSKCIRGNFEGSPRHIFAPIQSVWGSEWLMRNKCCCGATLFVLFVPMILFRGSLTLLCRLSGHFQHMLVQRFTVYLKEHFCHQVCVQCKRAMIWSTPASPPLNGSNRTKWTFRSNQSSDVI